MEKKFSPKLLLKKKGRKKSKEAGIAINMLLAKRIVFSKSLCSLKENIIDIMLARGRAIINPDNIGFFKDNQLAKDIIMLAIMIFKEKINMVV